MLVLSRKAGEKLVIGDNITITVVEVAPGKIKIGIDAPRDVLVRRSELIDQWNGPAANEVRPSDELEAGSPRRSLASR